MQSFASNKIVIKSDEAHKIISEGINESNLKSCMTKYNS